PSQMTTMAANACAAIANITARLPPSVAPILTCQRAAPVRIVTVERENISFSAKDRRSLKISNASRINPTNRRRETRRAGLANMSDRAGDVVDFGEECDVDATSDAADGGAHNSELNRRAPCPSRLGKNN